MLKIKDNIYGSVELDQVAEEIIHTLEFQRLRKVRQLGFNYLTFSGANHTRFEHSIGVYHLGQLLLKKHNSKGEIARVSEGKEFLMACLLHDIGHGPFSHTSEYFYNFDHEKMGIAILQNPEGEINKILRKNKLLKGTCAVINKTHENPILNKMLSSGVDLDRLDYLNRDSFYTGVHYGKIKFNEVLDNLKFTNDKIYFEEDSKLIAENFFMCRYYMFNEVYLNKETRIYETLTQFILDAIKSNHNKDFKIDEFQIVNTYDAKFEMYIEDEVLKLNDERISKIWKIIKTSSIHQLQLVDSEEEADIVIPSIKKNIVDDKNTVFLFENSRFKKIQTANSILNEFLIEKECIFVKF